MNLRKGILLGFGHPLLDICANVDNAFLEKYKLEENNVILAGPEHKDLPQELVENYNVQYIAGGSTQNTIRVAQWVLGKENAFCTTFLGTVGDDEFGRIMCERVRQDGVNAVYTVCKELRTGTCSVLLTNRGLNRSICAFLGASKNFTEGDIREKWKEVETAEIIYSAGFTVTSSLETVLSLAKHAHESKNKIFAFNLSAPYLSQFHGEKLLQVLPYVDYLFGNSSEVESFAQLMKWAVSSVMTHREAEERVRE